MRCLMMAGRKQAGVNMGGAAWNPKNKTLEQEFEDLTINKNEYCDVLTTEECLIQENKEGMSAETAGCTGLLNQLRGKL